VLDLARGPALTRSEAERRLLALVRAGGLPEPEVNVRLCGYEVDFLWREHRLVVEVDGFAFHGTRAAFERDRRKDGALADAGFAVRRVTWRQLVDEPARLLVALARTVA
jgi:very-short-patch-repair endonuclease